jgi:ABC-2 type transport system ATP-binding protein
VFALLGENEARKTTLIRCLTGFLQPNNGTCRVLGFDPTHQALEIRRRIGYVSDSPALYDWMRVGEIGWFASSFYEAGFFDRYRHSISIFQVPEDRKIKHLSKGQKAKVALSLGLAHDPELLILDEPTSSKVDRAQKTLGKPWSIIAIPSWPSFAKRSISSSSPSTRIAATSPMWTNSKT